jgi:hypothetical protein
VKVAGGADTAARAPTRAALRNGPGPFVAGFFLPCWAIRAILRILQTMQRTHPTSRVRAHPRCRHAWHTGAGLLLLASALLIPALSLAQTTIYRVVDENGQQIFTDQPPRNARETETIELPEPNSAPPPPAIPTRADTARPDAARPERSVRIEYPENETTVAMGPGDFSVQAAAEPALARFETLQLLMDGTPVGPPQRAPLWQLQGVLRGPHDLIVERLNNAGEAVARSDSVRVYVLRPSLNQPQRPR